MTIEITERSDRRVEPKTTEAKQGEERIVMDSFLGRAVIRVETPDDISWETDTIFGGDLLTLHKEQINKYGGLISGPDSILSKLKGKQLVYKWKPTPPTPEQSKE